MPLEITETFEYFFIAAMAMMIYAALYFVESEWKLGGQNSLCVLKLETPLPHKPTVHQFLLQYRDRIRDAMQEDFNQIFFRKIQDLYPKLEEHGIQMPCGLRNRFSVIGLGTRFLRGTPIGQVQILPAG